MKDLNSYQNFNIKNENVLRNMRHEINNFDSDGLEERLRRLKDDETRVRKPVYKDLHDSINGPPSN